MPRRPRVKLITLPWELEVPTLTLASLAAVTPDRIDVAIVDLLRQRLHLDEAVDLVGITASTPRINAAYLLADLYRSRGVKVVLGGHHVTALPDEGLLHADAVVCGEGETSWQRICDQLLTNPSQIQGIYRDPPPDLATLPQPRIDLMHMERYGGFYYPLIASRGCPEACSFCFAKKMTHGYRTYPIAHVIEQVRRRPKWIRASYFVDDNLPADPDHSRELFRALRKEGVLFAMQARHEFSASPERLRQAREAGCILISSGYESIHQMTLDGVGKHATAADYLQRIRNVFEAGILPSGNWMFGFDWDTPDTFERLLEFLDQSDLLHVSLTAEIPFPGTAAWKRYRREGRLLTEDYDHYLGKDHVVVRPKQMEPEALREGIRWLALQFYSPRRTVLRTRKALENEKILPLGNRAARAAALAFLSGFQLWQWHYRMVPSLQWLYRRLADANKYRYVQDALRGTNFWASAHTPAGQPGPVVLDGSSPFHHAEAHQAHRRAKLVPKIMA